MQNQLKLQNTCKSKQIIQIKVCSVLTELVGDILPNVLFVKGVRKLVLLRRLLSSGL
jgi:hypothetical protein